MDCAGGTLVSTKKLERVLSTIEKREGITGPDHSGCFEGIAPRMFVKTGEIAVSDVLGHDFFGGMDVLFDGNGTKGGWCYVLVQVQVGRWFV